MERKMTPYEVKETLKRVNWLRREIEAKNMKLAALLTDATHVTAVFSPAKAQGADGQSKPEEYAERSDELTNEIRRDIAELREKERLAYRMINVLEESIEKAILVDYHLNGYRMEELEESYHYSGRQLYYIKRRAYKKIADNFMY